MATVADPVAMRMSAATSQPKMSGESCAELAALLTTSPTPLLMRIRLKPPPAPTTRRAVAVGPRQSSVNFRICARLKPRENPNVKKLTTTEIVSAQSGWPRKFAIARVELPFAATKSATVERSISRIGSEIVKSVIAKPGRDVAATCEAMFVDGGVVWRRLEIQLP